ncbi:Uncharacterised protein [Mycobacteroides abscessus subsp. abscessus]|nr:Uncharacterised protein [Mycobacteroides abscessus subsp. abscessus]
MVFEQVGMHRDRARGPVVDAQPPLGGGVQIDRDPQTVLGGHLGGPRALDVDGVDPAVEQFGDAPGGAALPLNVVAHLRISALAKPCSAIARGKLRAWSAAQPGTPIRRPASSAGLATGESGPTRMACASSIQVSPIRRVGEPCARAASAGTLPPSRIRLGRSCRK